MHLVLKVPSFSMDMELKNQSMAAPIMSPQRHSSAATTRKEVLERKRSGLLREGHAGRAGQRIHTKQEPRTSCRQGRAFTPSKDQGSAGWEKGLDRVCYCTRMWGRQAVEQAAVAVPTHNFCLGWSVTLSSSSSLHSRGGRELLGNRAHSTIKPLLT